MTEAWLVRHAETEWSRSRRHTGRTDVPLTDEGRAAARALPARLPDGPWAAVWTSPLSRAAETAALAGFDATPRDDLLEWDYGDYEGITTAEIHETRPDWSLWRDGCPNGESPADVARRCDRVVADLLAVDGRVLLFAHGHVLRTLAARWIEQPPETGGRLALSTAAISALGFERETRVLHRWNAT